MTNPNPVLMIAFNNLPLTKLAIASVLAQSIPIHLTFIDNGSTDGTREWMFNTLAPRTDCDTLSLPHNVPVTEVANVCMERIFSHSPHLLGVPNDVIIHPDLYREFLRWPRGIVTGSEIRKREDYEAHIQNLPLTAAISENTPMAVMLTRRWAYQAIVEHSGYFFDPKFTHYASDCCLAMRLAACGVHGIQLNTPYWHYGSASVRLADPFNMARVRSAADADRAYFVKKYGFRVDSLEYGQMAHDINFRANPIDRGDHA